MRIPLDYYQILGVTESNLSDLEQAYRDRLLQLPRQGYSDAAIESRKQLITVAYQVLSDVPQREKYEATRLAAMPNLGDDMPPGSDATPAPYCHRPDLEISPEHFLGSLLILFERGEYEEINSICMPYLGNNGRNSNSGSLHPYPANPLTVSGNLRVEPMSSIHPAAISKINRTPTGDRIIPLKPDIVLTMVFSFLELGDREWRDGCYEKAVIHFETGQKILIQEDLFPQIQGQIDRRLDRLRPYRILFLVAQPVEQHEQRRQGIQFLEELLEIACINEVECQERFGLNSERTIQFIHETLPHLTASEQRNLFSQIARDSYQLGENALNVMQLACTYLHVHALIAQGFGYRNPQLIYTAQQILQYRLSQRLDVTIEQAICALLLGQTEEASQILTTAAESAALVVIRQQSQGFPDLLRGLCWYIESWLKDEVFPCFYDLVEKDYSLNAYFNDRDVQEFAERVPAADSNIAGWATSPPRLIDVPPSGDLSATGNLTDSDSKDIEAETARLLATAGGRRSSSLNTAWQSPPDRLGSGNISPALRVGQTPPPAATPPAEQEPGSNVIQLEIERQRRRSSSMPTSRTLDGHFEPVKLEENRQHITLIAETSSQLVPTRKDRQLTRSSQTTGTIVRSRRPRRKPHIPRILLVGTGGIACAWGAVWLVGTAWQGLTHHAEVSSITTPLPNSTPSQSEPEVVPPSPKPAIKLPVGILTTDTAQTIVKTWLSAKTKSLSAEYQTTPLKDILVEPVLSSTIDRAQTAKTSKTYWKYQHPSIKIAPLDNIDPQATVATIQAEVTENAQYYANDRLDPQRSYSKIISVQYSLIRQADRWYIKDMDVLKSVNING